MPKDEHLKILEQYLKKGDTVIAAVSGGPDSVFLLMELLRFDEKLPLKIIVAHVNHKLRGGASDLDERFVGKLAKTSGLTLESATITTMPKGNIEEESRTFRYRFFEKLRIKHHAKCILTAHHRDDNVETVLFNLIRGSSLNGIKGMKVYSPERYLLRPLLNLEKKEILASLDRNKIRYRIDSSNRDTGLSRNLLRHKIIPLLRRINSCFETGLIEFAGDASEIMDFLDDETARWLERNATDNGLPLEEFLSLPAAMQKNILAGLYLKTHNNTRKFNKKHLNQLLQILGRDKAGIKKEFGDNKFIRIVKPAGLKKRFIKITATH